LHFVRLPQADRANSLRGGAISSIISSRLRRGLRRFGLAFYAVTGEMRPEPKRRKTVV
jgi:hypothetical protein